jgi:hypothetical protein
MRQYIGLSSYISYTLEDLRRRGHTIVTILFGLPYTNQNIDLDEKALQ